MSGTLSIIESGGGTSTVYEAGTQVALLGQPTTPSMWNTLNGVTGVTISAIGTATAGIVLPNNGASYGPDTAGSTTNGIQEAINFVAASTLGLRTVYIGAGVNYAGKVVVPSGAKDIEIIGVPAGVDFSTTYTPKINQLTFGDNLGHGEITGITVRGLSLNELDLLAYQEINQCIFENLSIFTEGVTGKLGIVIDNSLGSFSQYISFPGKLAIIDQNNGVQGAIYAKGYNSNAAHYQFGNIQYIQSSSTAGTSPFEFANGTWIDFISWVSLDVNFQNIGSSNILKVDGGTLSSNIVNLACGPIRWENHETGCSVWSIGAFTGTGYLGFTASIPFFGAVMSVAGTFIDNVNTQYTNAYKNGITINGGVVEGAGGITIGTPGAFNANWTVDISKVRGYNPQGFAMTNFGIPASGTTAYTVNENPFTVRCYVTTAGTGAALSLKDLNGTISVIGATAVGQMFELDPGTSFNMGAWSVTPAIVSYGV